MSKTITASEADSLDSSGRIKSLARFRQSLKSGDIGLAAAKGALISVGGFGGQKLLQIGSNLILSRILFPEAFGLMALATVFLTAITMLGDIGIRQSIIQNKKSSQEDFLNTAWTMTVIRGFAIAAIVCLVAWPASKIYGQSMLFPLLCAVSISAIFQGFSSTAVATQNRDLKFSRVVGIDLFTTLLTIVITVVCALQMKSVWSLAIGSVTGSLIRMLLSHLVLPGHRLKLALNREYAGEILRFGRWILAATLVNFVAIQGLPLIQGWFVSIEVLGLLAIATSFAIAPRELLLKLIGTVAFPYLSRVVNDHPEKLGNIVRNVRIISNGIAISLFLGLAAVAEPLIELLYDDRYIQAGLFLKILAVNGALGFMPDLYQSVQLSKGKSHLHFYVMAMVAVSRTLGMIVGFHLGGVITMLYGLCVGSLAAYFLSVAFAYRAKFFCFWIDVITLIIIFGFSAIQLLLVG